jgi:MFS family permease
MFHEYAWPSSSQLEFEARRMHATPGASALADLAPAMVLSALPEAFDFCAVAVAAVVVFPRVFFPGLSPAGATAAGLAILALAPAVRWLLSPLFAPARRRHGRGVCLTAARVMLGTSTAAIAFLPDAGQAGLAAALLLLGCRSAQGLAMAGLADGRAEQNVMGHRGQRGLRLAIHALTGFIGLAAAGGVFAVMAAVLHGSDFAQWGWRYPFVAAIALNTVGLFADLRLLITDGASRPGARSARLATVGGVEVGVSE